MYSGDTLAQGEILSKTYGKFLMLNWVFLFQVILVCEQLNPPSVWSVHVYKNHWSVVISAIQHLR